MKILLIAPQPFFRIRGTPINVKNIVKSLAAGGHQVDLLCYPFGDDPPDLPGVRIIRGPGFPGIRDIKIGPSLAKIPLDFLLFIKAWSCCRRNKYEVIHAVEEAVFFSVWLSQWFKTRLIYDMDSVISDQLRYSGKVTSPFLLKQIIRLEAWAIRHAAFVLTVCQSLSDTTREIVPEASIVQIEDAPVDATYAPDPALVSQIKDEFDLHGHPVAVYTGNFESYQGVDFLIEGAPFICEQVPEIRVLLVGGQQTQIDAWRAALNADGIDQQYIFTGVRPIEQMAAFMEVADVLLSPRREGTNTALKIYSYMQSGKAILATDLPTHTQVLDASCAKLVATSCRDIAEGLIALLKDPDTSQKLGQASAARVEEKYSLARFQRQVISAYEAL